MEYFASIPPTPSCDLEDASRRANRVGLSFFVFLAVSLVVATVASIFIMIFLPGGIPAWANVVVTMVALYGCAAPLSYLVFRTVTPVNAPKRKLAPTAFFLFTLIAFTLMIAGSMIGEVLNQGVEIFTGTQQESAVSEMINDTPLWLICIYTVGVAPLLEELFFRKLLIDRLRPLGQWMCMLVSGVFFGLFHGNIEQFSYAALIGILLGYVYYHTSNVWYCVAMHAILNFFCGVLTTIVTSLMNVDFLDPTLTDEALADLMASHPLEALLFTAVGYIPLICAVAGAIIFALYFRRLRATIEPCPLPVGTRFKTVFLNVGTILFTLLCMAEMVLYIFS